MKTLTKREAWAKANEIFPTDYDLDEKRSQESGYPVYSSKLDYYDYICDLNDRLELNFHDRPSMNIWYEDYEEYILKDAIGVIDEAIYQFEDKIRYDLAKDVNITEALKILYSAAEACEKALAEK